ncbi:kinase [Thraustotheca clavata]|uniref:Kinase n=1 Tax=Thraustotheca clavata TaxID=74557 RepID=A0A1W0A753_9STRA|nr:kinase [Thraustotheca clavata]
MKRCRSPYIVDIVAASNEESDEQKLVLEYMDCGDLRSYLDAKQNGEKTKMELTSLEVAWVVANALLDLHYNNLLHRDLKSHNILLSRDYYIKVSDLGISREYSTNMTHEMGTWYWMAPETIGDDQSYDYACDIYSFGIILSELDSLHEPYHDLKLNPFNILNGVKNGTLRPIFSKGCEDWLRELAEKCLAQNPHSRPTAIQIVDILRKIIEKSHSSISTKNLSHQLTSISCQWCMTSNPIVSKTCINCSNSLPDATEKLSIMLKRIAFAKERGLKLDMTILCLLCNQHHSIEMNECDICHEHLGMTDEMKLMALEFRLNNMSE